MTESGSPPEPTPLGDAEFAAENTVLHSERGERLLASVAEVPIPGPSDLARWRRDATLAEVAAAVRLVESRRRGAAKFTRADQMWLTRRGLEQATAEAVADHKARRFAGVAGTNGGVVDLCSGIGGDAIAIARAGLWVVAVDRDPAMATRVAWNADVYEVAEQVESFGIRAEDQPLDSNALIHVDPDRRVTTARKANALVDYVPGPDLLRGWVQATGGGAIKLGPASDFAEHFGGREFEIEVVSLRGECKEATAWFGRCRTPEVRRRATALPSGATWTDRDGAAPIDPDDSHAPAIPVGPVDRWVFDPDPALVRAGLVDSFARSHGWARFVAGVHLLTGPEPTATPLANAYEVVAELPLDLRTLRREVARRGLGPLDIKTRGLDTPVETLRRELRAVGTVPATWIMVGSRGGPGRAILARRVDPPA